jgi:aspartokinase/homoserine dehydrogenase 1
VTDNNFGNGRVDFKATWKNIRKALKNPDQIYIITGFIAKTSKNETTTLGRGGSDFSASLFGAALGSSEIEIWTDVDGVLTADPKKVPGAYSISQMTYEEAMELSHFGAKVIHPPTMQPALEKNIPIRIKNTLNPQFKGTLISKKQKKSNHLIRGLSSIDAVALLQIQGSGMIGSTGIAERILNALAKANINIILISQASSEHSICLGILPHLAKKAKSALEKELRYELHYGLVNEILIESNMAVIAVVGENMRKTKGIAGKIFQTLGRNGVNIAAIAQGSSELNISIVILRQDVNKALNSIHHAFFKAAQKEVNLFIIGTGLIGSKLLEQIQAGKSAAASDRFESIHIAAIANSKKMNFDIDGISKASWQEQLSDAEKKFVLKKYVQTMKNSHLSNKIFVDNSASKSIAALYADILGSAISIVTPNKIANSQSFNDFKNLQALASKNDVSYLYEATVGAGLPVISTIQNMAAAGDKITRIEAILSGTLSFIFNSFDGSKPFSQIVLEAKEKGYTEPDPREDLS